MTATETRIVTYEALNSFCRQAYMAVGVPEEDAVIVSDLLVRSDLRGIETHGVLRLPIYIRRLQKNYVRRTCEFNVLRQKGATAFVSVNGSLGHLVAFKAMDLAISLAETHGVSWVSVKDSSHFGAAGLFSMMAVQKEMIGYVCSNSAPLMAPYGGRAKIIGNNPLSYAFPADHCLPVVADCRRWPRAWPAATP